MTLAIPYDVRRAGIATSLLDYEWDEWRVRSYYDRDPTGLAERLEPLSLRAQIALTAAIGAWICERFSRVDADPRPLQFLEAVWAGTLYRGYCVDVEPKNDDWRGPARGPLAMVIAIANDALFSLNQAGSAVGQAVWMHSLARHVLPSTAAFDDWLEKVLTRLLHHHLKPDPEEEDLFSELPPGMGSPVPLEAFDPDRAYDPSRDPELLDAFLRRLDWRNNPYLRAPEAVIEIGELEGTPYRYP